LSNVHGEQSPLDAGTTDRPLEGRVIIVTGGNRGIGLALAHSVGAAGARVVIWGRSVDRNEEAVTTLRSTGASATHTTCDVTDEGQVLASLDAAVDQFGRVDSLFANAAITGDPASVLHQDLDTWNRVIQANVVGTLLPLRAAGRRLIQQGEGGALVAVSSIVSRYGAPRSAAYAASKAAIESLSMSLAVELAPHRVRCNVLAPGWTDTDMLSPGAGVVPSETAERLRAVTTARTPARRWASPEDIAAIAPFLADPRHDFHTGSLVVVDGGYSIW
jgi:NAD(P)-dependent dehydrogenase (short-subunit alcohol dehydrogenase family)